MHPKGRDISPFIGPSWGRMGIGPLRKKLVIPSELLIVLVIKEIKGTACCRCSKNALVKPPEFWG